MSNTVTVHDVDQVAAQLQALASAAEIAEMEHRANGGIPSLAAACLDQGQASAYRTAAELVSVLIAPARSPIDRFRVRYVAGGLGDGPWVVAEFEPGEFSGAEIGSYRHATDAQACADQLNREAAIEVTDQEPGPVVAVTADLAPVAELELWADLHQARIIDSATWDDSHGIYGDLVEGFVL